MHTINLVNKTEQLIPSKVVCIGRNYVEHIKELNNEIPDQPVVFVKPNSAISNTLNSAHLDNELHYEAELSFLYQGGQFTAVALGLDLTKRAVQSALKNKGLPWERAKAFDGSALFSDFVHITQDDIPHLALSLSINDELRQSGGVELMMLKPDELLAEIQSFMTLADGDIVMTGTPKGVGVVKKGDTFVGKVKLIKSDGFEESNCLITCQWQAQ